MVSAEMILPNFKAKSTPSTPDARVTARENLSSPASDTPRFRKRLFGTGEGNQVYGYGIYSAEARDTAEFYRKTLIEKNPGRFRPKGTRCLHHRGRQLYVQRRRVDRPRRGQGYFRRRAGVVRTGKGTLLFQHVPCRGYRPVQENQRRRHHGDILRYIESSELISMAI